MLKFFYHKIQNKLREGNRGMTYVELIVVLSIFAIISSVSIFNYKIFQDKVDIKNLSNDIALKVVEAQKSALSGQLPVYIPSPLWKPSYGLYFNLTSDSSGNGNTGDEVFYYFMDLDQNKQFDGSYTNCSTSNTTNECIEKINITKRNFISSIQIFYQDGTDDVLSNTGDLNITFMRPNSGATFWSNNSALSGVSYVKISLSSDGSSAIGVVKVYASGRIEIN